MEAALKFLDVYKPRVSIIEKLNTPPDVVTKDDLKRYSEEHEAADVKLKALDSNGSSLTSIHS